VRKTHNKKTQMCAESLGNKMMTCTRRVDKV